MGLSEAETVVPAVQRNLNRMQRVLEALLSLARASEQNHEPVAVEHLIKDSCSTSSRGHTLPRCSRRYGWWWTESRAAIPYGTVYLQPY